jgi:hypothetical protein
MAFYPPRGKAVGTRWIGGWMGAAARMRDMEQRYRLTLTLTKKGIKRWHRVH